MAGRGSGWAGALAASLLLALLPGVSAAGPDQHFDAHGPARSHFGGHAAPAPRGGMRLAEGPPHDDHYEHGGPRGHFEGGDRHYGHFEGGGRDYGHFEGRPRYAVPPHWEGMHPHWDDDWGRDHDGWVRPWGPRWVPGYWGGGYWRGGFWPHVYLDWDFPWFLATLPLGYSTYWWGNVPYYYWRGVYYVWSPDYGEYVVTDPPPVSGGTDEGAAPPPSAQAPPAAGGGRGALSMYVYPKNGQSEQQTENDRYQCHQWAVGQTGFDPTNSDHDTQASTATPGNYKRAVTACLEARGYSVR